MVLVPAISNLICWTVESLLATYSVPEIWDQNRKIYQADQITPEVCKVIGVCLI